VVNDAKPATAHAMSRAVELPHTLHPFTMGCIWKMLARRRQVQPDVIPSVEWNTTPTSARDSNRAR
jgi:hypothetical protein